MNCRVSTAGPRQSRTFVFWQFFCADPSTLYAAKVHGEPMKPRRVASSSISFRMADNVCPVKARDLLGSRRGLRDLRRSKSRTGLLIKGPLPWTALFFEVAESAPK
jgi:hypothetical protein